MSGEASNQRQTLAALLGQWQSEKAPTLDENYRLLPKANSWAESVEEDILARTGQGRRWRGVRLLATFDCRIGMLLVEEAETVDVQHTCEVIDAGQLRWRLSLLQDSKKA